MSAADLEVQVVDRVSGTPLATVSHQGTKYVVAEAGEEFQVKVKLYNGANRNHKVYVTIDGQDVGYAKIFYATYKTSEGAFEGFLHSRGADAGSGHSLYKAFKFGTCKPSQEAAVVDHPDEIKAGIIEVKCDEVTSVGHKDPAPVAPVKLTNDAERKRLPEGKKWFLAPGLKAEAGATVARKETWNNIQYATVRTVHLIKIRYDTAENLVLRKILNPSHAAHRAILRNAKEARIAAMGRDPDEASSRPQQPRVKPEGSAAAAVKRERGIKRERGEEGPDVPRSATADRVDLTGEAQQGPLVVAGRALGADELAVCDLCDSDDEAAQAAPRWTVQKKQAIDL